MEGFLDEGKSVSIVLDLSLNHDANGRRIIDIVKRKLNEIIKACFEHNVDSLYLYHPDIFEMVQKQGEQFSSVGNYETDGVPFKVFHALKQSLYVLTTDDFMNRKYLLFITDRCPDSTVCQKIMRLGERDLIDCQYIFIGIGNSYNRDSFQKLPNYFHLDSAEELNLTYFEDKNAERQQSETNQ